MCKDEVHLVDSSKCNDANKVVNKIRTVSKSCFLVMVYIRAKFYKKRIGRDSINENSLKLQTPL